MIHCVDEGLIAEHNGYHENVHRRDLEHMGNVLSQRGLSIEALIERARGFTISIPSWGVGTGGTRFSRFPSPGEPRTVFEKMDDCSVVEQLTRITPSVSLHIPWDRPVSSAHLAQYADERGLRFCAMNSNTFQDPKGSAVSYKYGSLTHVDPAVRRQAIEHNVECIEIGQSLGSKALTVWLADGGNFPGQVHTRKALDRYLQSLSSIYEALPHDWTLFLEHKLYEPAFYSTVNNDWGTSYYCARELGDRAQCLVDLGHHAPTTNVEMIVARLLQFRKLGGFHFNDSKYGDDDLDTGSIDPYRLFLVFDELVGANDEGLGVEPTNMLDQSHNVTDPIESLICGAMEAQRAYLKACLVDRRRLAEAQESNDAIMATRTLKAAFETDVSSILASARMKGGGAFDPIELYRSSGYRQIKAMERPPVLGSPSGIV